MLVLFLFDGPWHAANAVRAQPREMDAWLFLVIFIGAGFGLAASIAAVMIPLRLGLQSLRHGVSG